MNSMDDEGHHENRSKSSGGKITSGGGGGGGKVPTASIYVTPPPSETDERLPVVNIYHVSGNSRSSTPINGSKPNSRPGSPLPKHTSKHNHSIQDLLKLIGIKLAGQRKVQTNNNINNTDRRTSCFLDVPRDDDPSQFRLRSKSLDDGAKRKSPQHIDCNKAYQIYEEILKEGAVLRRSSLDPDRKRLSLSAAVPHRGSDLGLDPAHAAILFRDSRGLPVADPFLEKVNLTDLEEDESQIFVKFFKFHKCYDLIPTSAKLVVFDTQLLVKKAFFALVDNGVRAAPLWDSVRQEFVGMLTITDFIKILQKYYTASNVTMDELEQHKLETWKNVLSDQKKGMISIGPDVSLYDAIKVLIHNRIHRLPVIDADTGNVLYILTHKRILRFLFLYINDLPKPSYMNKTLSELKIGTYENVETVLEDTTIILALKKFVERRVSALPIVDPQGRLVDIFAKFDVINLAAERTYDNLDITLKKANEHRNEWFEGVHRCNLSDTLFAVLEKIVKAEVHRLVVVNEEEKVIGILSLSDLLVFLVLRPCGDDKLNENCEESYECILMKEKLNNMSSSSNNKEDERRSSSQLYASRTNNNENSWKEIVLTTGQ